MSEETRPIIRKFILITGGNSGIGLEACKIFCKEGHKVVATVRSKEKGDLCVRWTLDWTVLIFSSILRHD